MIVLHLLGSDEEKENQSPKTLETLEYSGHYYATCNIFDIKH